MESIKTCVSCGMPMRSLDDHAMKDASKSHCVHCARPDGSLKSYEEALAGMSGFLRHTQGMDEAVARKMAAEMMAKLPAWRTR
jgi:Putative zinc ribbon domain